MRPGRGSPRSGGRSGSGPRPAGPERDNHLAARAERGVEGPVRVVPDQGGVVPGARSGVRHTADEDLELAADRLEGHRVGLVELVVRVAGHARDVGAHVQNDQARPAERGVR